MNQPVTPKKILVIRNDKIGDFMLAWPAFSLLKKQYPDAEITALVPEYTSALARKCEWIDNVLIDDKKNTFISDITGLRQSIKALNADVSISFFSELRTALALWLSGTKNRIGPATKVAQFFLNNTLKQQRSRSLKPEYEYNLDLTKYYIASNQDTPVDTPPPPYLFFKNDEITQLKGGIRKRHGISEKDKIVIVHPGTGGSAINLSVTQYAELITKLSELSTSYFIITAGPGELPRAESISECITPVPHFVHKSTSGIIDFCKFINSCDLFISGSTGPLHIAGALDVCTTAFYPLKKSASPVRWETLNSSQRRLAISGVISNDGEELAVDINESAQMIIQKFFHRAEK